MEANNANREADDCTVKYTASIYSRLMVQMLKQLTTAGERVMNNTESKPEIMALKNFKSIYHLRTYGSAFCSKTHQQSVFTLSPVWSESVPGFSTAATIAKTRGCYSINSHLRSCHTGRKHTNT